MKRKLVPPFIMLLAGAVTSIVMFLNHYEIKTMLWILVAVLVSFYIIGVMIKKVLDSFEEVNKSADKLLEEGTVIKKEVIDENSGEEQEGGEQEGGEQERKAQEEK